MSAAQTYRVTVDVVKDQALVTVDGETFTYKWRASARRSILARIAVMEHFDVEQIESLELEDRFGPAMLITATPVA